MKEWVFNYWSDTCERKAMGEASAKEIDETYPNVQIKEAGRAKKDFTKIVAKKQFILVEADDFWRDGQWVRYWEERIKTYDVEVQPDQAITFDENDTDRVTSPTMSEKE